MAVPVLNGIESNFPVAGENYYPRAQFKYNRSEEWSGNGEEDSHWLRRRATRLRADRGSFNQRNVQLTCATRSGNASAVGAGAKRISKARRSGAQLGSNRQR